MGTNPRRSPWHFPLIVQFRYYQQHFLDDIRQAAIDILLGNTVNTDQLNIDWSHYLDILDNCCLELIPAKPPKIEIQLNTHADILYATAMFNMTRFVFNIEKNASSIFYVHSIIFFSILISLTNRIVTFFILQRLMFNVDIKFF